MLKIELPPITTDLGTIETMQESTDLISKITTIMSGSNLFVGIVLGGSMQELYGLIRSM